MNNEEEVYIDMTEMAEYIIAEAKKQGVEVSEDVVNLILDLEDDYLNEKGLIEFVEE
ncbi:MAG: hypothetical protein ACRCTZ_06950 [Sarcina sp.]